MLGELEDGFFSKADVSWEVLVGLWFKGEGRGDGPPVMKMTLPLRSGISFAGLKDKPEERRPKSILNWDNSHG